jgi:hypothetical protein
MRGREADDDKLNRLMYSSIQGLMQASSPAIERIWNAPRGADIYYTGLANGARVYFIDAGEDENGLRTFLKAGICGSKNTQIRVINTFTGNKGKNKV